MSSQISNSVSPSVYVAFTQLYAQNRCGQVGSNVMLTTLAFDPQDLSTSSMTGTNTGLWTAINYAELAATRCICTTNCSIETFFGTITNTCTPQMSIPTKVSALISEWKSCFTNYGGIFDPPVVLSPGKGLTLPKATDPKPTPDNNNPNTPLPIVAGPAPAPASPIPPGPIQTPAPPQSNPSLNLNPLIESQNLNPQPSPIPPNNPSQQENTPQNLASLLNNPSLNPNPPTGPQTLNPQPNPNPPNNPPQENNPQNPTTISNNPTPNNPSEPAPQQSSILPSNPLPPSNNAQPMNNVPSSQNNLQQGQSSVILALGPSVTMMMVNGQELTANPQGNFVVGSQTLVPGGPPITMDNSPSSSALPMGSGTPESHPQVAAIGGQSITTNSQGNFVVGGQTITPGGPTVTIAGTPVSIPIGATQVIVGATIIPVNTAIIPIVVLTINEQPITANGQGNFVIGTQTLTPGGSAVTISGTPISIGPGMTQGVVGGTTTSLRVIIDSFLTTANAPSNTPTPAQYTGGVDQGIRGFSTRRAFAGLVMSLFMMWL
ncbi:hypothetical protein BGZ60DRAFT_405728 [Tricladium varicosporioides]|nr:hypothetical protein BGZ60DRAFT_405728 [Hymenoscyphus varicosporioides]